MFNFNSYTYFKNQSWLEGNWNLYYKNSSLFKTEWNLWTNFCHLYLDFAADYVTFSIAVPPIALWFDLTGLVPLFVKNKFIKRYKYQARKVGISIHDNAIWWQVWKDPYCWSSTTSKWKDGSFHLDDFLLGKIDFSSEILQKDIPVIIPLPEGSYRGTAQIEKLNWKRPRWFTKKSTNVKIDMREPIPVPGKGENSWDCEDDALYVSSFRTNSISEAIGDLVGRVLETRTRRASLDWSPKQ